jgi:hypothetical protein
MMMIIMTAALYLFTSTIDTKLDIDLSHIRDWSVGKVLEICCSSLYSHDPKRYRLFTMKDEKALMDLSLRISEATVSGDILRLSILP